MTEGLIIGFTVGVVVAGVVGYLLAVNLYAAVIEQPAVSAALNAVAGVGSVANGLRGL